MSHVIDFIHGTNFNEIKPEIVAAAERALIDTLGVAAGGSTTELSTIILNHAAAHFAAGDGGSASMWFDGRNVSAAGAVLANGMTIDSLDAHDGQKLTKGHVGCGVIPSSIAMMQATGETDPKRLIEAVVMGYELGSRAGIALHQTVTDYHTSGAWIALAAAAIGARLLKLSPTQTREALGIAEYHGPRSQMMRCIDHPTMVKDGSGWGAMAGISAAYLAREGFTGAPALTIEQDEVAMLWSDLGSKWYITDQYVKLYPVCRWAQPAVEAVLALKEANGFEADAIEHVEIRTFHEAKRLATMHPATTEEAQYSLPFPVATALIHGTVSAQHIASDALKDENVRQLCKRISMTEAGEYNAEFPARRMARAIVTLNDGSTLTSDTTEAVGDPENPVDAQTIDKKFRAFTKPVLGADNSEALIASIKNLAGGQSCKQLFDALQSPSI